MSLFSYGESDYCQEVVSSYMEYHSEELPAKKIHSNPAKAEAKAKILFNVCGLFFFAYFLKSFSSFLGVNRLLKFRRLEGEAFSAEDRCAND